MADRILLHRFMVNFEGSFADLVKEFNEAFDPRWYFVERPEDVQPGQKLDFGDCEISLSPLTHNELPIDRYPRLEWNELTPPNNLPNFVIDFYSFVTLDTPKTRRHLREVAKAIPGDDAILTLHNRWVVGVREDHEWNFCDVSLLPHLADYKQVPEELLVSERDRLDDLVDRFTWEKGLCLIHIFVCRLIRMWGCRSLVTIGGFIRISPWASWFPKLSNSRAFLTHRCIRNIFLITTMNMYGAGF